MKVVSLALLLVVAQALSPITRVVQLLNGLSEQTEKDGEKEETLFEKYVCWAKTIISTKTATNAAAEGRIQELETYIADIEAGRIEFTSERVDLEKELKELNAAIEEATDLRGKEHEDFLVAEDEMVKASTALDSAINVLGEATAAHKEGVFLQTHTAALSSASQRAQEADVLNRAVQLGGRVLSSGDARFLRRLLTGDVPKADWKKLNRKATFKMGYKARSFKIQDVLAKLNQTFTMNLADARAKEAEAQSTFDTLMESKHAEKAAATEALEKMESENGVRGMTKEESQNEVDALKTQVADDTKFIEQTEKSLGEKKEEWKERKELRAGEIAAISKAIAILSNDDAKDNFKKSFTSQGYSLLQMSNSRSLRQSAASLISHAGTDRRLSQLATLVRMGNGTHFAEVLKAIDEMVVTLEAEGNGDLEEKEACEKAMMEDTRTSVVTSRSMDELTDAMTKLKEEIEQIVVEVAEKGETIKKTEEELAAATVQRGDEKRQYTTSDAEDKAAADTVVQAKDVLSSFYSENNLMLLQAKRQAPVVVEGEAPPPPPSTWEAPYGGKTEESTGIIAVLENIIADINKDMTAATAAEKTSQTEFDTYKKESEELVVSLESDIADLNTSKGDKEEEISQKTEQYTGLDGELGAVMKKISDAKSGCDFIAVNFVGRMQNRQIEMDGLNKAKAILLGASFPQGPDPNRAMKPGDAALIAVKSHLRR